MTKSFAGLAAVLVATLAGCAPMCQSPWDYCSAVLGCNGTPNCNFGARYNSQFVPMNGTPPTTPVQPKPAVVKETDLKEGDDAPQPLEAQTDRSDLYEEAN